jgi:hypothetical protein
VVSGRRKGNKGSVVYIRWNLRENITQVSGDSEICSPQKPEKQSVVCYSRMVHFELLDDAV